MDIEYIDSEHEAEQRRLLKAIDTAKAVIDDLDRRSWGCPIKMESFRQADQVLTCLWAEAWLSPDAANPATACAGPPRSLSSCIISIACFIRG
jgi:hypothetical protein